MSFEEFISTTPYSKLFCKPIDDECGNGIFILTIHNKLPYKNGYCISIEDLKKETSNSRYLFQLPVEQHSNMSMIYDKSINTIRLVTVKDSNGQIIVLPSILRIGSKGNIIDNTSKGGIMVGINFTTGTLNEYGFNKSEKLVKHPDSNILFKDFHIPHLKEAVSEAILFHSFLSDIHSIGWDISIGKDGPVFIEGNDDWEINGPQTCNHGMAKEFKKYFQS